MEVSVTSFALSMEFTSRYLNLRRCPFNKPKQFLMVTHNCLCILFNALSTGVDAVVYGVSSRVVQGSAFLSLRTQKVWVIEIGPYFKSRIRPC